MISIPTEHPWMAWISGLVVAFVLSTILLIWLFSNLPSWLDNDSPKFEDQVLHALNGFTERIIYFAAAYFGAYELIGGWLILKTVANFKDSEKTPLFRSYYVYMFGSALSLIFGAGGAILTRLLLGLHAIPN